MTENNKPHSSWQPNREAPVGENRAKHKSMNQPSEPNDVQPDTVTSNPTAATNPSSACRPLPAVEPVFLRMPSGPGRELWPGSRLNYWKLRSLVAPGPWNNRQPPVRAYELRKTGLRRGVVLIERSDIIDWLDQQFRREDPESPRLPRPSLTPPPTLTIPPVGGVCPYTQLRHTIMYELSLANSPYGQTNIYVSRYLLPGRKTGAILMQTQSVLQFIRSCRPPKYKISPNHFNP